MRGALLTGCVLLVCLYAAMCDTAEETTDINQDEEEYEDIAVAESQDIGHSQLYPHGEDSVDRPRPRPRGRKRRRRLRKRPRSTTPAFIEEYDPERTVKEEEPTPVVEGEPVYQRRRPSKRRRRPARRKPEYNEETPESEVGPDHLNDRPPQEHYRQRNSQRRRRKGGRKRIRVTTELIDLSNDTRELSSPDATSQPPEVVVQSNDYSADHKTTSDISPEGHPDETTPSILTSAFTTKEITELNHKLESLSENHQLPERDYHDAGLRAFSVFQPTTTQMESTTENLEENHIISSASSKKQYPWVNRFNPQHDASSSGEETTTETSAKGLKIKENKKETVTNIKNIEQIIENRKSLFSTSKRLPPTSAVIRRRIRPRKHRNSTSTQETVVENTIPTINPTEKKLCHSVECALNITSVLSNNIIPSSLLPSGFPTMPEILSTAELIQKMSLSIDKKSEHHLKQPEDENSKSESSSNIIIITPSTLVRSPNNGENTLTLDNGQVVPAFNELKEQTEAQSDISTSTELEVKTTQTPTIETSSVSPTDIDTTPLYSSTFSQDTNYFGHETLNNNKDSSIGSESLRLDGVNVSNINDEILELIMDEMGKARVKRILEIRNMTLSELIAHRERGAGHFSDISNRNDFNDDVSEISTTEQAKLEMEEKIGFSGEDSDEEQTEQMIVEKAKHFLSEYKKSEPDDSLHGDFKKPEREFDKFGQRLKVQATVIAVPILEPTHTSVIQFPNDGVLGAFPNYMYDISGKRSKMNPPITQENLSVFTEPINKPKNIQPASDTREPRVFESMPKFSSSISNKDDLEISPFPDWRITVSKSSTQKTAGFPGISEEIMLVARTTTKKPTDFEEVILLDEGEEVHHLRNHILGGNINVESRDILDEDYPEEKRVPAGVKSAIAASGALLLLAIFGFLAVLVSCKIRQRRARLRVRRDILNEQLAEDIRSSQRSLTPVLRKSPFNHGIHSNTASNRHYYLWRTLRKTFQYE